MKFYCRAKKSLVLGAMTASLVVAVIVGFALTASRSDAAASRFGRGDGVMIAGFMPMAETGNSSDVIPPEQQPY